MGYGDCRGCDEFTFLVDGLCVGCRRIASDQEDTRIADLRICTCLKEQVKGKQGLRETHIVDIDSECSLHGSMM